MVIESCAIASTFAQDSEGKSPLVPLYIVAVNRVIDELEDDGVVSRYDLEESLSSLLICISPAIDLFNCAGTSSKLVIVSGCALRAFRRSRGGPIDAPETGGVCDDVVATHVRVSSE